MVSMEQDIEGAEAADDPEPTSPTPPIVAEDPDVICDATEQVCRL